VLDVDAGHLLDVAGRGRGRRRRRVTAGGARSFAVELVTAAAGLRRRADHRQRRSTSTDRGVAHVRTAPVTLSLSSVIGYGCGKGGR